MAVHLHKDVEIIDGEVIISNSNQVIECSDGSKHVVPVINSKALEFLQENNNGQQSNSSKKRSDTQNNEEVNASCDSNRQTSEVLNENRKRKRTEDDLKPNIMKIFMDNDETFLNLLANYDIITDQMRCSDCSTECYARWKKNLGDGFVWQCKRCKKNFSIRTGTPFMKSRLPLNVIFQIIYYWAQAIPGHTTAEMMPTVSSNTIYNWYKWCREIVHSVMQADIMFTGEDVTASVQIDESMFGKKQKYHRGKYRPGRWYFGISQSSAHKCLIVPVASRDEKTLGDIIKKHVDNSCSMKIVSDGWASYRKIKEWGYDHSVVIHKSEFKNSAGDHTNSIESIWSQLKTWIDSMHGLKADCYDHYISEFLYRYNFCGGSKSNCFDRFMSDLREVICKGKK